MPNLRYANYDSTGTDIDDPNDPGIKVDSNGILVSTKTGLPIGFGTGFSIIPANIKADGVTDNTAAILAAINSVSGDVEVLLPTGIIICNNLVIPVTKAVKLRGTGRAGLTSNVLITGTRLQATGANNVIKQTGPSEGTRAFFLTLQDLSVWGNGSAFNIIDLKYASYFRAWSCSFNNTSSSWLKLWDVYDSRFWDCEFTFGGSSDGTTAPGVECFSEGGSAATNEIYFIGCRWESFAGAALGVTGSNSFCIRVLGFKMESSLSSVPFVKVGTAAVADFEMSSGIVTSTKAGATLTSLIDIAGATAVKIDCRMQVNGVATTIAQYVKIATSVSVDINVKLLSSCPVPTSGYLINWDTLNAPTFSAKVQTALTTPAYNYSFGSQLSLIDSSMTSVSPTTGTTYTVPPFISGVAIIPAGTLASLTIALPAIVSGLVNGQQISFYFQQTITTLTVTHSASVSGAPTTAPLGSFFTMRWVSQNTVWYRVA